MSSVASRTGTIPERVSGLGPLTRTRLWRTAALYAAIATLGLVIALLSRSNGMQAFGLGLIFPGGGFIHFLAGGPASVTIHATLTIGSLFLLIGGLFLWFATGNALAPPLAWLATALGAGAMGHAEIFSGSYWLVPGLAIGTLGIGVTLSRRAAARKRRVRGELNEVLGRSIAVATPTIAGSGLPAVEELSAEDLAALRFALDRALQPVEEFNGFEWIEQFQPSAVRYQINNLGYSLSLANYVRLPAMHAYLAEAQRNLIEKKKDYRVWKYWALENLWGNLRNDPDPIRLDNVMYSGWYAAQIGMYASNSGDSRYDVPGSITLTRRSGKQFAYDYPSIVEALSRNERGSAFCLFPCEPNWIYPFCNNQAVIGVMIYDRLHDTENLQQIEARYRERLAQEFIDVDGHFILIRSTGTGFTIPGLSSAAEDANLAFWMHPTVPDIAVRGWEIARHQLFSSGSGELELLPMQPKLDPSNYQRNRVYAYGVLGMAAAEFGDGAARKAVADALAAEKTETEGGVLHYPGGSVWAHTSLLNMRLGRTNGIGDLVRHGMPNAWQDGPILAAAKYPDVLVAKAVSDGAALELACHPGRTAARQTLGIAQLKPGGRYRVEGALETAATADREGKMDLEIELDGRSEVRVLPAD